ncbi:MAG: dTDP-4-dehydrorhamnose reductase [Dissulfurispiraceae bacterium]
MNTVLIGADGQLGTDLLKTTPKQITLIPLTIKDLDITDRKRAGELLGDLRPDAVINTAAYVKVDEAEDNVGEAFKVNAEGVKNLVEACKETKTVFIHLSTDYVFDGDNKDKPYNERDIPNPVNVYGISKFAGELFVRNYLTRYYLVRSASLYGQAGASGKGGNFVYSILKKAKSGVPLNVVNDIYMSPTYALDLAIAIWKLLLEEMPFGVYHITNSGYCSWYEFSKKILDYSGLTCDIIPVSHRSYSSKARRPVWSPLTSIKGVKLRDWGSALSDFTREASI